MKELQELANALNEGETRSDAEIREEQEVYEDTLVECPCGKKCEPEQLSVVPEVIGGRRMLVGVCGECLAIFKEQNV